MLKSQQQQFAPAAQAQHTINPQQSLLDNLPNNLDIDLNEVM